MGSLNNFAGRRREKMNRKGKKRKGKKKKEKSAILGECKETGRWVCGLPWALTESFPNLD